MEFWKIGTNIDCYIRLYFETYKINNFESIHIKQLDDNDYGIANNLGVTFYKASFATISQIIRIYLSIGLLSVKDDKYLSDESDLKNSIYIVPKKFKNLEECFIYRLKEYVETKEAIYWNEHEALFSIALSTIYFFAKDKLFVENSLNFKISEKQLRYYKINVFSNVEIIELLKKIASYNNDVELRQRGFYETIKTYEEYMGPIETINVNDLIIDNSIFKDVSREYIESRDYLFGKIMQKMTSGKEKYITPVYQRNYVWSIENCSKLYNDILGLMDGKCVYLNSIIVKKKNIDNFENISENRIIDGQQRLTTLILLARAIYDIAKDTNQSVIRDLFAYYFAIDNSNGKSRIVSNFQHIEGNDELEAFKEIVDGRTKFKYQTNYYKNYNWFKDNLKRLSFKELENFSNKLLNNVILTITLDSIDDEMMLFESVNTNAIKLTTMDLFKNFSLSLVEESILEKNENELQKIFDEKIASIFPEKDGKTMESFIEQYLRLNSKQFDSNSKFKVFKSLFDKYQPGSSNLHDYENKILFDLSKQARLYKEIKSNNKQDNQYCFRKVSDILFVLDNRDIYVPLIMHILNEYYTFSSNSFVFNFKSDKSKINELRKILFEIERFEMIFQIAFYRGQSLTTALDSILSEVKNHEKFSGSMISYQKFNEIMFRSSVVKETLSIQKNKLVDMINEYDFKDNIAASRVLTRIDNYLNNNNSIELSDFDNPLIIEEPSREHIMPVDYKKWEKYLESLYGNDRQDKHTKNYNKIGNAIVMTKGHNSKVKNSEFSEKKKSYSIHNYLTKQKTYIGFEYDGMKLESISKLDNWNIDEIEKRTRVLSRVCADIWLKI